MEAEEAAIKINAYAKELGYEITSQIQIAKNWQYYIIKDEVMKMVLETVTSVPIIKSIKQKENNEENTNSTIIPDPGNSASANV